MPRDNRVTIWQRDKFICQYCEFDGNAFDRWFFLTVDHVKPYRAGGTEDASNKVTACAHCNFIKGGRDFPSFEEAKAYILDERRKEKDYWESEVRLR